MRNEERGKGAWKRKQRIAKGEDEGAEDEDEDEDEERDEGSTTCKGRSGIVSIEVDGDLQKREDASRFCLTQSSPRWYSIRTATSLYPQGQYCACWVWSTRKGASCCARRTRRGRWSLTGRAGRRGGSPAAGRARMRLSAISKCSLSRLSDEEGRGERNGESNKKWRACSSSTVTEQFGSRSRTFVD